MRSKVKSPLLATITLLHVLTITTIAQQSPPPELYAKPSMQSPEAASFGKFGDIPVSLFNGSVAVNIPLTQLNVGTLKVPIALSYDASGCRPDIHPGWVGLNWTLLVGGVITRHMNNLADERGSGYFENCQKLADPNWATIDYSDYANRSPDLAPDEFSFNVNGISGVFMMNHERKWIVRSKDDPNIRVEHQVASDYILKHLKGGENLPLRRVITTFTLTMSDGTKYVFGREQTAIEFSIPGLPVLVEGYNASSPAGPERQIDYDFVYDYINASAWRLSEVTSINNNVINFTYSHTLSLQQTTYTHIGSAKRDPTALQSVKYYDVNQTDKYLVYTSVLNEIECDNGIVCSFFKSPSRELPWIMKYKPQSGDFFPHYGEDWEYYKLDALEVKVNGVLKTRVTFGYIENVTERLKLSRVRFNTTISDEGNHEYAFEYNSKKLPVYNTGREDHWGYYNGRNFWGDVSGQFEVEIPNLNDYYVSREPDPNFMDAEVLTQIRYPTGGVTKLFFEPHDYSKMIDVVPSITLTNLGQNIMAGGLRIKRMETLSDNDESPIVKEYFYKEDYLDGGDISSGVVSGKPRYYDYGTNRFGAFVKFSSSPANYLNTTNGNHITYSQVTEKGGGGYVVYRYTNQDNGYLDKDAFAVTNGDDVSIRMLYKLFGKLELERGQVLSMAYFDALKNPLKKVDNFYNEDPARYNKYVRVCQSTGGTAQSSFFTYPIYTFFPYLRKTITTDYFRNQSNVTQEKSYEYYPEYNVVKSEAVVNSYKMETTTFKYNFNILDNPSVNDPAYNSMRNRLANNVIQPPVEITKQRRIDGQDYVIDSKCFLHNDSNLDRIMSAGFLVPVPAATFKGIYTNATALRFDPAFFEEVFLSKYDSKGNLMEARDRKGVATVYLWGFGQSAPIASIVNASYAQVEAVLGAQVIRNLEGFMSDSYVLNSLSLLRDALPQSQVHSYTIGVAGLGSESDLNNRKISYNYDQLNRLKYITDDDGSILQAYGYHNYIERTLKVNPSSVDFGLVPPEYNSTRNVAVTNTGNSQITITGVWGAPQFSIVSPVSIASGETRDVVVRFSPSENGTYNPTLIFQSNAERINAFSAIGVSNSTKVISVAPQSIDFGGMMMGSTKTAVFTITNTGTGALQVTNIVTPDYYTVNWTAGTINPNESKQVTITFSPSRMGQFSGTVVVESNKTSGDNTIAVTGAGTPM